MSSESSSSRNPFMEWFCDCLPNCEKAVELAETGIERELTAPEKLRLKYNGRLCPFCACATGKFESVMNRMKEAQEARKG
jgi:hypothetical protein